MQRRSFLKLIALSGMAPALPAIGSTTLAALKPEKLVGSDKLDGIKPSSDYLQKIRNPNEYYPDDVISDSERQRLVRQLAIRLGRVKKVVGHGNFSVLSFDEMLRYGKRYSKIGKFGKDETDFLDQLFHEDAMHYGFYGKKPLTHLTATIERRSIEKVPDTGQFLFKGEPIALYSKIKRDLGENVILTSGVRSVVKQMHLFLNKASKYEGNLSLASRSLAPPGYSFHGVGDFDVGHKDLGAANFTDAFAKTDEYKKLIDLGYIDIRYPVDNHLGVRFEPWHIKVT